MNTLTTNTVLSTNIIIVSELLLILYQKMKALIMHGLASDDLASRSGVQSLCFRKLSKAPFGFFKGRRRFITGTFVLSGDFFYFHGEK